VHFTDLSTGNPTSWTWFFGDGDSSLMQNPSHIYTATGLYSVTLIVSNAGGTDTLTRYDHITVDSISAVPTYLPGTVHCDPSNPTAIIGVTNPTTGKIWMDRNLGASQVALSNIDTSAYGDLYQWGRFSDGHQCRTSMTTSTLSSSDMPGHGNFIMAANNPFDWRTPQNTSLWQGVTGVNNPCPTGYRLPTEAELNSERLSWSHNNTTGAFLSPLRLPLTGFRNHSTGSFDTVGSIGSYWSSTVSNTLSRRLYFLVDDANMSAVNRARANSVRCIKD
jgi:uncharacterized protein (TIGR02145 family)